jgi:hypothetical protein
VLFGHFLSLRIFCIFPSSVGCDPSQGYFFIKNKKKYTRLERGLQGIF